MITHCPITGVNLARFLLSVFLGFAFIFGFDSLIHGNFLKDTYAQTPDLWRPEADMMANFPFMIATQFLIALISAFIFTRHYEGKGISEGLRFGAAIGALMGVMAAASYAWMPISSELATAWCISGFATGLGLGFIFALFYRK